MKLSVNWEYGEVFLKNRHTTHYVCVRERWWSKNKTNIRWEHANPYFLTFIKKLFTDMKELLIMLMILPFSGYGQSNLTGDNKFVSTGFSPNKEIVHQAQVSENYLGGDHKYVRIIRADNKRTEGNLKDKYILSGNVEVELDDIKILCDSLLIDRFEYSLNFYGKITVNSGGVQMNTTNLQIDFTDRPRLVFNPEDAKALGLKMYSER